MDNNTEGNLISFKVVITTDGSLVSELSYLPIGKAEKIFKQEDFDIIKKIISEGRKKLEPLHNFIQEEVQSV